MKDKKKASEDSTKRHPIPTTKKRFDSENSGSDITEPILQPKSIQSKLSTFKIRTISSLIMVGGFILILCAGHFYCCLLVLFINICIFKEIIALKRNQQREAKLPYFSLINWYFFGVTELIVTSLFISNKMILSSTINVVFI
jgi:Cytidylyltransferase family